MLCYDDWDDVVSDAKFAQACDSSDDIIVVMSVLSFPSINSSYPISVDIIGLNFDME